MAEEQASPAPQELKSSGALRKGILYGLLTLMLLALAYDYGVARPAVSDAYDKIMEANERTNSKTSDVFTKSQVTELLGQEPAESFREGGSLVEVYAFRGGLPFKPHKLYAVYKKQGDHDVFFRHEKFVHETDAQFSPDPVVFFTPPSEEPATEDESSSGMSSTGGESSDGGDGEPGRGRGPRGGGFDPEAMFAERDADGDGKLIGDEVSDRMKENLSEIDKDGDGAISKEELMQRFEERRASFGGGQGGPGGGGPEQGAQGERAPRRPPPEE